MKAKLLLTVLLSFSFYLLSSQVPKGFNYQAVARDGSGMPITDPINVKIAILSDDSPETVIWEELHTGVDPDDHGMFSIVVGQGTWQSGVANFSLIDWTLPELYIRTKINDVTLVPVSKLWAVPYTMVAEDLSGPVKKLEVEGVTTSLTEPLFEVRNVDGKSVFAVYNDGVSIHVDKRTKGPKGGFSVGGFEEGKDVAGQKYLFADAAGVNVYIDDNPLKDAKGGFSVGGFDSGKGGANFLDVSYDYSGTITTPVNRILWYPQKNAFLAGNIKILSTGDVGVNSFAAGYQAKAKGNFSQAMGYLPQALGANSTAIGNEAVATLANSYAIGDKAAAQAIGSYAIGSVGRDTATLLPTTQATTASGDYAFAIGMGAVASGNSSTALGINSNSTGVAATALGVGAIAEGDKSTALMAGRANGDYSFASGFMSKADGKYSIAIGHGITKFGGVYNHASGDYSLALGYSRAYGFSSNAIGTATVNSDYATGIGHSVTIDGDYAIGLGTVVDVSGDYAAAIGSFVTAESLNSFVVGRYNVISTGSPTVWNAGDPLFVIGNGTSSVKSNAMTVLKNGNVGIGTVTPSYPLHIARLNPGYVASFVNEGGDVDSHGIIIYAGSISPTGLGAKFISFQHPAKVQNEIGSIQQNGSGNVYYGTSSDFRMKTKIADTHFGIADLMQVKVRDFEFKSDPIGTANTGFIAQELFEFYPLAVIKPRDPEKMWQIDYGRITPLIVKAVQDQQLEIESLKEKVKQLETLVQQLIEEK